MGGEHIDPWTHEHLNNVVPTPELVYADEEELQYRYGDGPDLIIPAGNCDGVDRLPEVFVGPSVIRVRTPCYQTVLIPRGTSTSGYYDFYDGIVYPNIAIGEGPYYFEMGKLCAARSRCATRENPTGTGTHSYDFADFHRQIMIPYTSSASALPVAFYNGLVWWEMNRGSLIPTFIDLLSPGKVFCQPDKIIIGPHLLFHKQGSESRNSSRFVIGERSVTFGLEVIDLVTGFITSVVAPSDFPWGKQMEDQFFPGFMDRIGAFLPRCFSKEVGLHSTR